MGGVLGYIPLCKKQLKAKILVALPHDFLVERITKDNKTFKLYYKVMIISEYVDGVGDRFDAV